MEIKGLYLESLRAHQREHPDGGVVGRQQQGVAHPHRYRVQLLQTVRLVRVSDPDELRAAVSRGRETATCSAAGRMMTKMERSSCKALHTERAIRYRSRDVFLREAALSLFLAISLEIVV